MLWGEVVTGMLGMSQSFFLVIVDLLIGFHIQIEVPEE